ncbi:MAG: cyclic nucleotide-binding domain-containing protein [Chitinivibrionales bacterium]|nr:cyclic nucleotide-binding domain-containing protein [Chitinivibrionales bacterium]
MDTLPLISSNKKLNNRINKLLQQNIHAAPELIELTSFSGAVDFLNIEMPELVFINFSDVDVDVFGLMGTILNDPWLLHGGIIALCEDYETVDRLNSIKGGNTIATIIEDDLDRHLPQVMRIIKQNKRILFQREIGSDFVDNISGSFKLSNDPLEASCYANLVCNFLYNSNRLDAENRDLLNFAINEMLMNAVEHGNCGITYDEKTDWLENGGMITELIKRKNQEPGVAARHVTFEYAISMNSARFVIADEGAGFDWRKLTAMTQKANPLQLHGRGIAVTKAFTKNMRFNEPGNEVSFEITYQKDAQSITPSLFKHMKTIETHKGDYIFKEGEPSNFLYFIAKGEFDVLVKEQKVSTLSADDVFMGEMSFLLNNRRSATVQATCRGKLIKISKKEFVEAIKKKPHYALFLSRLLAQRVQRANASSVTNK